ncbi:MAG: hypothetical protein XD69_0647 [Clostridia bacterium 62_21]|nr:MAG: hypothetical protein XD69_0647 [Clostridia bacterium 62_21]
MARAWRRIVLCLLVGTLLAAGGSGCGKEAGPKRPPAERQPLPEKTAAIAGVKVTAGGGEVRDGVVHLASFAIENGMIGYAPRVVSPDGRWVAFQGTQAGRQGLWVMALDGSRGRLLARVGEKEHAAGTLLLHFLGWTRDNRAVLACQGTQADGAHRGQRGISIRVAAPDEGEAREVAWLPVPTGIVRQIEFSPGRESVYVQAGDALWRLDITGGHKQLLRDGLPSYDGLFYPRLSPTGDYYVYELWEPDKKGIYVLCTRDAEEKVLKPNGPTWNFGPRFSADGSRLAYYTAPLRPGSAGEYAGDYDIIPAEDGPASIAEAIEIATPGGEKVARVTVPGAKLANFRWAADGRHLAFVAGKVKNPEGAAAGTELAAMAWHSLWVADADGKLTKVADLTGLEGVLWDIQVVNVSPDGKQVYYLVSRENELSLWLAREGKQPVEVAPGGGPWHHTYPGAVYGEDLFISRSVNGGEEVFRVRGTQATQITADGGCKAFLQVEGSRLVYVRENWSGGDNESRLVVLDCSS